MKKLLIATVIFLTSCGGSVNQQPQTSDVIVNPKYKRVVLIEKEVHQYEATITTQHGGNVVSRGAKGALIGGAAAFVLGGDIKDGAILGGTVGASTTSNPTYETRKETRTDITYWFTFSDSTREYRTVVHPYTACPFQVGDSIRVW